jgi:4a-hydroxytetrahydrobiopterin dehydratase
MNGLSSRKCADGDVSRLKGVELKKYRKRLGGKWRIRKGRLEREYAFKDFRGALGFANKVGALAEKIGHHPDIYLAWGKVGISIWTHKINGLTESDFILAAKIGKL